MASCELSISRNPIVSTYFYIVSNYMLEWYVACTLADGVTQAAAVAFLPRHKHTTNVVIPPIYGARQLFTRGGTPPPSAIPVHISPAGSAATHLAGHWAAQQCALHLPRVQSPCHPACLLTSSSHPALLRPFSLRTMPTPWHFLARTLSRHLWRTFADRTSGAPRLVAELWVTCTPSSTS